jgi:hypothetical protein
MRRAVTWAGFLSLAFLTMSGNVAMAAGSQSLTTDHAAGTLGEAYTMSGTITLTGLRAGASYRLLDAFEALPTPDCPAPGPGLCQGRVYRGSYTANFDRCSGGSIASGSETIGAAEFTQASALAPTPGMALTVTAKSAAALACHYRVSFAGRAPPGAITSARNHVWVFLGGAVASDVAGPDMPAPVDAPPPTVPEAPIPLLLPLTGLLTAAVVSLVFLRRRALPV